MTWKYHVDESSNGRYEMILGRGLLTSLGMDLKFSDNFIIGSNIQYEGLSAPMVDVSNYKFILLIDKTVNQEESFIISHINYCPKYQSTISSTRKMRRIQYAKFKKEDLNMIIAKKC